MRHLDLGTEKAGYESLMLLKGAYYDCIYILLLCSILSVLLSLLSNAEISLVNACFLNYLFGHSKFSRTGGGGGVEGSSKLVANVNIVVLRPFQIKPLSSPFIHRSAATAHRASHTFTPLDQHSQTKHYVTSPCHLCVYRYSAIVNISTNPSLT